MVQRWEGSMLCLQRADVFSMAEAQAKKGFPGGTSGKEPGCQCRRLKRCGFDPWVRKIPWRRAWQPIPVFLPEESHGQRSLVGYSPWGHRVGHDWSDIAQIHVDLNTYTHTIWELWVSVLFRDLLRTIAQEKASQMALRNYSQVVSGEISMYVILAKGVQCNQAQILAEGC